MHASVGRRLTQKAPQRCHTRYLELLFLIHSNGMVRTDHNNGKLCQAYFCNQGKHRSTAWSFLEACILRALGFSVTSVAVCAYAQATVDCQRNNEGVWKDSCQFCDPQSEASLLLGQCAVDEFFQTLLLIEDLDLAVG